MFYLIDRWTFLSVKLIFANNDCYIVRKLSLVIKNNKRIIFFCVKEVCVIRCLENIFEFYFISNYLEDKLEDCGICTIIWKKVNQ